MSYILIPQYIADWFIKHNERLPSNFIVIADYRTYDEIVASYRGE